MKGEVKISWVKWFYACKYRNNKGRDIRPINIYHLFKWRWRMLLSDSSLWFDILVSIYGVSSVISLCKGYGLVLFFISSWLRGISLLG